jgi:hypothetical protein
MASAVENKRSIDSITGVYTVKPIKKSYLASMDSKHSGATMFERAVYSYAAERDQYTGLVNSGLTKEEQAEFEAAMNLPPNALSPYNMKWKKDAPFTWADFRIAIPKEGLILDTDRSDKEKFQYKVLLAGTKVAKSTAEYEANPTRYELLMTSKESESKTAFKEQDTKKKAFLKMSTMGIEDYRKFLNVYEEGRYRVGKDATSEFIESEVGKIVDTQPAKFLELVDNPNYKTMVFLQECMSANIVYKQGTKYFLVDGEILGNSFLEAVTNLNSPDYNGTLISLKGKLEGGSNNK